MTERELIESAISGDQYAWQQLYETNRSKVFNILLQKTKNNREDAEDLMQLTFMAAYRNLTRFRTDSKLSTWLHSIAVNQFLMKLRSAKNKVERFAEPLDGLKEEDGHCSPQYGGPDRVLESFSARDALSRCISQLPARQRQVMELRAEEYEHHEIAKRLGCSIGNSKSTFFRACVRVRKLMASKKPIERPPQELKAFQTPRSELAVQVSVIEVPSQSLPSLLPMPEARRYKWSAYMEPLAALEIGQSLILSTTDAQFVTRLRAMLYMAKETGLNRWSLRRIKNKETNEITGYSVTKAGQFESIWVGQGSRRLSRIHVARSATLMRYPILQALKPYIREMHRWDKLGKAAELFKSGERPRAVAKAAGISKCTAFILKKAMLAAGVLDPQCACGQPSSHRGWCAIRLAGSPARQAVMQRLHEKQTRKLKLDTFIHPE